MTPAWCTALPAGGVRIALQVAPNARRTEVLGVFDHALKIKLQAQPIEGKANAALVKFLADALGVARASVAMTHGQTSKHKLVEVRAASVTVAQVMRLLPLDAPA